MRRPNPRPAWGLNVRHSTAEIHYQAMRRGQPVEGWLLANTPMLASVNGQNFIVGTYTVEIVGFVTTPGLVSQVAAISGAVTANTHWSPEWVPARAAHWPRTHR